MRMKTERLDRILAAEEELVPSSGFLSSVMECVQEEAATPAPIPFPWKRVVLGVGIVALFVCPDASGRRSCLGGGGTGYLARLLAAIEANGG